MKIKPTNLVVIFSVLAIALLTGCLPNPTPEVDEKLASTLVPLIQTSTALAYETEMADASIQVPLIQTGTAEALAPYLPIMASDTPTPPPSATPTIVVGDPNTAGVSITITVEAGSFSIWQSPGGIWFSNTSGQVNFHPTTLGGCPWTATGYGWNFDAPSMSLFKQPKVTESHRGDIKIVECE